MKLLKTIKHEDIYPEVGGLDEARFTKSRRAVRVIVFDEKRNIALNYYPPEEDHPEGEYGLPGGGIEDGEDVADAGRREVLEEVGCSIQNIKEVGVVVEYIIREELGRSNCKQQVYCFVADIDGEKGELCLTESEKNDGLEVVWKSLSEAVTLLTEQDPSFVRTRGLVFLEAAKKILNK